MMIVKEAEWNEKYEKSVGRMAAKINSVRGFIVSYITCIDALHQIFGSKIEKILSQNSDLTRDVLAKLQRPPGRIDSAADLLAGLLYYMKNGRGGEWLVHNKEIFDWMTATFGYGKLEVGGVGRMANVLSQLGVPLVIPHVIRLPEIQARLFVSKNNIRIPTLEARKIVFKPPMDAIRQSDKPLFHWIFQFKKGTEVRFGHKIIKVPQDNRFIATCDEDNLKLGIEPAFEVGTREIIKNIDKVIVFGYHLMQPQYNNGTTYIDHVAPATRQLLEWRHLNPNVKIHLEIGSSKYPEIRKIMLEKIAPLVNSVGLNEDELAESLEFYGCKKTANELRRKLSAYAIFEGMQKLFKKLNVERLNVHTRNFSMSLIKIDYGISPETEQYAMLFGAIVSAMFSITGKFKNLEEIASFIHHPNLSISSNGLKQHELFSRKLDKLKIIPKTEFLKSGITKINNYWLIFSLSKTTEKPSKTVGLGDCYAVTTFLAETE